MTIGALQSSTEDTLVFVRQGGTALDSGSDYSRQLCRQDSSQQASGILHWKEYCRVMQKHLVVLVTIDEYLSCIKRMLRFIDKHVRQEEPRHWVWTCVPLSEDCATGRSS